MRRSYIIAFCVLVFGAILITLYVVGSDRTRVCTGESALQQIAHAVAHHFESMSMVPPQRTGIIESRDWSLFKRRFIRNDGQLVDSYSQLSHSEGQGYAMLLALAADDRPVFDRIWGWTRGNLKRDEDALLAWKWKPDSSGGGAIRDTNDAADGDILVAWALHRAATQWHEPRYDSDARPIAEDIVHKLVRDVGGHAMLLPGLFGFEHNGTVTVNLSYWIFPAFRSLNEIAPSPRWHDLERSGLYLLGAARFGREQLPSDWMAVSAAANGGLKIALLKDKPLYGFDAMRIPLYLLWDGKASPATLAPFLAFWRNLPTAKIPATVNLATGAVAPYPIPPGTQAIVAAVETQSATPTRRIGMELIPDLPTLDCDRDYYSAALGLLVRLALTDTS